MSRIDGEEFALDICLQIVYPGKALDLRYFALSLRAVDIPLAVRLDLHEQGFLIVLQRHDAVNSSIREADIRIDKRLGLIRKMLIDEILEHSRASDHVFAGNDIERRRIFLDTALKAFGNIRCNELQDVRADGRRDDISMDDGHEQVLDVRIAVDGLDMLDVDCLRLITNNLDVVAFLRVDRLDQLFVDIDKRHFIAGLDEQFTDKAAADIASTKMNCLFHDHISSYCHMASPVKCMAGAHTSFT